jgi:hypothetical protein
MKDAPALTDAPEGSWIGSLFPRVRKANFSPGTHYIKQIVWPPSSINEKPSNLYRQPADPAEKDVDAALKVLVAQERAAFFNLSTNNGVKSGWVRLMKEGDV